MAAVYTPSMVANFKLSFDEKLNVRVPLTPATVQERLASGSALSAPALEPLITASGKLNESFVLNRVPKQATVEFPGHRPAANFSLTFDFKEIPIDPRTVRAGAVNIYLGTVAPQDFADGMMGRVDNGQRRSVLDPGGFFGGGSGSSNLLMVGMIDEWQVEHGAEGSEVTVTGRDLRGVLIDTPIGTDPTSADQLLDGLKLDQPVHEVIGAMLANHPLFGGFNVRTSPAEWRTKTNPSGTPPSPGKDALPRSRLGAKGKRTGGRASIAGSHDKVSFWDLIVNLCYLVGAIPQIVGTELRIRPVRSLYDQKRGGFDPAVPSPFAAGLPRVIDAATAKTISPLSVRKMIYGRDIESISFSRKYGGYYRPKQIRCVGHDPSAKVKTVQALWPDPMPATRTNAGGGQSEAEVLTLRAPAGVKDVERLRTIAKALYEEIGRGELGGSCSTMTCASFGGDNSDPDLLRLRPGDAVQFAADVRGLTRTAPLVSEYTDHLRKSVEQRIQEVARITGDENLARVIVTTAQGLVNLQDYFRVAAVHYTWGEAGIKIGFDFQNFIETTFDMPDREAGPVTDIGELLTFTVPAQELG